MADQNQKHIRQSAATNYQPRLLPLTSAWQIPKIFFILRAKVGLRLHRSRGLLVIGYWLLVIGYWLLVIGYWLLVIGYWLLVIKDF